MLWQPGRLRSGTMVKVEEPGSPTGRNTGLPSILRPLFLRHCPQTPSCGGCLSFEHLCTLILVHSARELTVSSLPGVLTPRLEYYQQGLGILNRIVLGWCVSQCLLPQKVGRSLDLLAPCLCSTSTEIPFCYEYLFIDNNGRAKLKANGPLHRTIVI